MLKTRLKVQIHIHSFTAMNCGFKMGGKLFSFFFFNDVALNFLLMVVLLILLEKLFRPLSISGRSLILEEN